MNKDKAIGGYDSTGEQIKGIIQLLYYLFLTFESVRKMVMRPSWRNPCGSLWACTC
jgi:hypothetical protein